MPPDSTLSRLSRLRRDGSVLALLAAGLLLGLRSCDAVTAFDLAWADRLQVLHASSVDPGPVAIVSIDGIDGIEADAAGAAVSALVTRLLADGVAAVGLYLPAADAARHWPAAPGVTTSGWVLLPVRMPPEPVAAVPADPWPDSDGVVRRVYLRQHPPGQEQLQVHGVWALLQIAGLAPPWPERQAPPPWPDRNGASPAGRLEHPVGVPYAGPPGRFMRTTYREVLDGRSAAGTFRGKVVLVGAAGPAADWHATPAGGSRQPMAGVEWVAHSVDALMRVGALGAVSAPAAHGLGLALLLPWWLALGWLRLWGWVVATVSVVLAALALDAVLQAKFLLLWGPGATIATALLCASLWAVWRYRGVLETQQRQSQSYQWCQELLQQMPDAALACGTDGTLRMANQAAVRLLGLEPSAAWEKLSLEPVLGALLGAEDGTGRGLPPARRLCQAALVAPPVHSQHECMDLHGRDLLIKVAPAFDPGHRHEGWLLTILDISPFRARQRQRDDELHFLGHDLRGPQSAALAVLELARQQKGQVDVKALIDRVERHMGRALAMSDGFIQLLRAQDGQLRLEPLNLVNLLEDVVDDHWDRACVRGVDLACTGLPDEAWVRADREMLGRALGNLVGNAVKFTLTGTPVRCGLLREGGSWVIEVSDQGPGIAHEDQEKLFRPFSRAKRTSHVEGAGLGLPMVKAVVERHLGRIEVRSVLGQGTVFRVVLSAAEDGLFPAEGDAP